MHVGKNHGRVVDRIAFVPKMNMKRAFTMFKQSWPSHNTVYTVRNVFVIWLIQPGGARKKHSIFFIESYGSKQWDDNFVFPYFRTTFAPLLRLAFVHMICMDRLRSPKGALVIIRFDKLTSVGVSLLEIIRIRLNQLMALSIVIKIRYM